MPATTIDRAIHLFKDEGEVADRRIHAVIKRSVAPASEYGDHQWTTCSGSRDVYEEEYVHYNQFGSATAQAN